MNRKDADTARRLGAAPTEQRAEDHETVMQAVDMCGCGHPRYRHFTAGCPVCDDCDTFAYSERLSRTVAAEVAARRPGSPPPDPEAFRQALAEALNRAGHVVVTRASQAAPAPTLRSELLAIAARLLHLRPDWEDPEADETLRTLAIRLRDLADGAAPRAPQAAVDAHSPGGDAGAAPDHDRRSTATTGTHMRPEDVPDEWVMLASTAHRTAPQKRDGKPTRMRHALAAASPAIRAQVLGEVRDEIAKHRAGMTYQDDIGDGMRAALDVALNVIDRAARGDA